MLLDIFRSFFTCSSTRFHASILLEVQVFPGRHEAPVLQGAGARREAQLLREAEGLAELPQATALQMTLEGLRPSHLRGADAVVEAVAAGAPGAALAHELHDGDEVLKRELWRSVGRSRPYTHQTYGALYYK